MGWQVWADTGGTFTDCLARAPDGLLRRAKVLSSSTVRGRLSAAVGSTVSFDTELSVVDDFFVGGKLRGLGAATEAEVLSSDSASGRLRLARPLALEVGDPVEVVFAEEAPVLAARVVTGTPGGARLPELELRLATTRGTNALLERRGAAVALFVTAGFGDLLAIGNQQRPDLFALAIEGSEPLYESVVEVEERLDASGAVTHALNEPALERAARAQLAVGVDCAAVALLHSYRNPEHELAVARILESLGFRHVSVSARLAPRIQLLPRAETAVVNAYLSPVVEAYLGRVEVTIGAGCLQVMTSAGGLRGSRDFVPKDSLLSGPAGGVVGAATKARASGYRQLIAFDMGGTSTDVSRHGGSYDYRFDTRVGGVRLMAPALAIETVAAGGGSICWFDGNQLRVGPESAGAAPGPAAYGAGGPLTITDVNLLLGRVDVDRFALPLDAAASELALEELSMRVRALGAISRQKLLSGLLAIANERMAEAIRRVSIRRGYAPDDHALVAFGGAGGQHACAVAQLLGVRTVLVPVDASLLSAFGLGAARLERFAERQVLAPLVEVEPRLEPWFGALEAEARGRLEREGVHPDAIRVRRRIVALRLPGQDSSVEVDGKSGSLRAGFAARYRALYGYTVESRRLEVESLRVIVEEEPVDEGAGDEVAGEGEGADASNGDESAVETSTPAPVGLRSAWVGGAWGDRPVYDRDSLVCGARFDGPALVAEDHCSSVIEAGWRCRVDGARALVVERLEGR